MSHKINQLPQKTPLIFPAQKNVHKKNLLENKLLHQNTWQYPVLTVTKNIQKKLLETENLKRTNPMLLQLQLSNTP